MISLEDGKKLFSENGKGTIAEAKQFLNAHNIHQLRKGETLRDALDSLINSTSRKGYEFKRSDGSLMSENQIIAASNKEAFMKFTPAEYHDDEVEDIDDICDGEDYRDDTSERGIIANCFYCGTCIRVDGDGEDYPETEDTVHCDGCMRDAIARLAM